jgi:hypothetical protein
MEKIGENKFGCNRGFDVMNKIVSLILCFYVKIAVTDEFDFTHQA